ncbi:MAG: hypothetical protein ACYC5N_05950 [Endomicrobiales bacterium]
MGTAPCMTGVFGNISLTVLAASCTPGTGRSCQGHRDRHCVESRNKGFFRQAEAARHFPQGAVLLSPGPGSGRIAAGLK